MTHMYIYIYGFSNLLQIAMKNVNLGCRVLKYLVVITECHDFDSH